jgi:hypothetical protein
MCLAEGVEMGTGRGAAVRVVAELMDMHATLGRGVTSLDVEGDGCGGGFGGLLESHGSGDLGISTEDCDC